MGPSDDEIRRKHLLSKDVPILRSMPSQDEIKAEPSFFKKLAQTAGYEEWMWKSIRGKIIAVIIILPNVGGVVDWWIPKVTLAYEYAAPHIEFVVKTGIELADDLIQFLDTGSGGDRNPSPLLTQDENVILAPSIAYSGPPLFAAENVRVSLQLWRVTKMRYADSAMLPRVLPFDTRWLESGSYVIHTSTDPLTALTEIFPSKVNATKFPLIYHKVTIQADATILSQDNLPHDWVNKPFLTRKIGMDWYASNETCLLGVPSSVIPGKLNFILNGHHPELANLVVDGQFDI